jgi:hypothetical protein
MEVGGTEDKYPSPADFHASIIFRQE